MGATVSELLWISYLLKDLNIKFDLLVIVWCDNKAAIQITENPVYQERTKHLEVDYHFIKHHFKVEFINPIHVNFANQIADIFTKALPVANF